MNDAGQYLETITFGTICKRAFRESWSLLPFGETLDKVLVVAGLAAVPVVAAAFVAGKLSTVPEWIEVTATALVWPAALVLLIFVFKLFQVPFRALKLERTMLEGLRENLRVLNETKPAMKFKGIIEQIVTATAEGQGRVLMLAVRISNIGQLPSILSDWKVIVTYPGAPSLELHQFRWAGSPVSVLESIGLAIANQDYLPDRTFPQGIEPGSGRSGWLTATLDTEPPLGSIYTVRFRDTRDTEYSCDKVGAQVPNGSKLSHIPGMTILPITKKPSPPSQ